MKKLKQFFAGIFPLPQSIQQIIQAEAFLIVSPNKNSNTFTHKRTILRCLQFQTKQQAQQKFIKITSLSNAFHLAIIKSQIKHFSQRQKWCLCIELECPQTSLKQKLNMNKNALNHFTENQIILILNCFNWIESKYLTQTEKMFDPMTTNQLIDLIFMTGNENVKLSVPKLMAPLNLPSKHQTTSKIQDFSNLAIILFETLTLSDKREVSNINNLYEKVKILQFKTFCLKEVRNYLVQKLSCFIESKKLQKENIQSFQRTQEKKFPSIRCLKSSRKVNNSSIKKQPQSKDFNRSQEHSLNELSPTNQSRGTPNKFLSLNEMAHDKIVESFQQDQYSYILQSNNSSPSRISPHKGFPPLGISSYSQQGSISRFSVDFPERSQQEVSRSPNLQFENSSTMRSSMQNSRNSGMQNSGLNSIIFQVEQESNYELVEGSSLRSDIVDLSFSQNNQETAELREVNDTQNGTRYFGEIVKGIKQGKGKIFYCDGGYYEGEWKDNQIFGFGRLFYPSNKLAYAGYWKNGCFHGPGLVLNEEIEQIQSFDFTDFSNLGRYWISYRGNFNMDIREGFGVAKISNGDSITGNWENNCLNGQAEYKKHDGSVTRGIWAMNKLQKILTQ